MILLLSVQALSKSYGHRPLFAGLSLDLRAGERVGLVGPNGAGKSTQLQTCQLRCLFIARIDALTDADSAQAFLDQFLLEEGVALVGDAEKPAHLEYH